MKCKNCDGETCDGPLCTICFDDPGVTISHKEVIKRLKLTEAEIKDANLFFMKWDSTYGLITKYLLYDVLVLAKKLYKDLDVKDPKKVAYRKEKGLYNSYIEAINEFNGKKTLARDTIMDLLIKQGVDYESFDDDVKVQMDVVIDRFIEDHIAPHTEEVFQYVMNNLNILVDELKWVLEIVDRRKRLDEIMLTFPEKYHKEFKDHHYYYRCVNMECTFDKAKNTISNHIYNLIARDKRKEELDEFVKTLPEKHHEFARCSDIYDMCVKGYCKMADAKGKIQKDIDEYKYVKERRERIERFVEESFDEEDIPFVQGIVARMKVVNEYVEKDGELDGVIAAIFEDDDIKLVKSF